METNNIDFIGIFRRMWPLRAIIILGELLMLFSILIPIFLVPTIRFVVLIAAISIFVTMMPINALLIYLYYVKLIKNFEIEKDTLSLKSSLIQKKISLSEIKKAIIRFQEEEEGEIIIEGSEGKIWSCRASHFKNINDFIRFKDNLTSLSKNYKFKIL